MVAQTNAAAALADLAVVPANRDEIVRMGGIEPLTALLYDDGDGKPRSCQESASAALGAHSSTASNTTGTRAGRGEPFPADSTQALRAPG